jgi:hypothetical protein
MIGRSHHCNCHRRGHRHHGREHRHHEWEQVHPSPRLYQLLGTHEPNGQLHCRGCKQDHWCSYGQYGHFAYSCFRPSHWCIPSLNALVCSSCCKESLLQAALVELYSLLQCAQTCYSYGIPLHLGSC